MDILKLTLEEQRKFLESFEAVFLCCDGVLWQYAESIRDAGEAVMMLKQAGKTCRFVTNNSQQTDEEIVKKLEAIGIAETQPEHIVQPLRGVIHYIMENLQNKPIFSLCTRPVNNMLSNAGVQVQALDSNVRLTLDNIQKIVEPTETVGAVLVDLNFNLKYSQLARAQKYLEQEDCCLLVAAFDSLVPIESSLIALGSGGFVKLLADYTGKQPIVLGKPSPLLFEHITERFEISDPNKVLFIGDSLEMDIQFGNECGFQTLLVLSGAWNVEKLNTSMDQIQPKYIASGIADFIKFFRQMYKRECKHEPWTKKIVDKNIQMLI